MSVPTRVFVRTNVAWHEMDARRFDEQSDPTRPMLFIRLAQQRQAIEEFHRAFGFDFFAFRAETSAIGRASLDAVRGARLTLGFEGLDEWLDDPEDELVFPIDDDDLFHPDLASLSSHLGPETQLVLWKHAALGHPPAGYVEEVGAFDPAVLMSNNWGVRKSFLRAHLSRDETRRFLADHGEAHRHMLRLLGLAADPALGAFGPFHTGLRAPSVRFIDGPFGIQLLHPASLTQSFYAARSGARLQDLDLESPVAVRESWSWAEPYVKRYESLMKRLASARARR